MGEPESAYAKADVLEAIPARLADSSLAPAQRDDLERLREAVAGHPTDDLPRRALFAGRYLRAATEGMPRAFGPYVQQREVGRQSAGRRLTVKYVFEPLGGYAPGERG